MITGKGIEVDDRSMTLDENDMAEYITVWNNGVPKWYKITHNNKGAYINLEGKRYYVLINEG
jgi:hypothetical protein